MKNSDLYELVDSSLWVFIFNCVVVFRVIGCNDRMFCSSISVCLSLTGQYVARVLPTLRSSEQQQQRRPSFCLEGRRPGRGQWRGDGAAAHSQVHSGPKSSQAAIFQLTGFTDWLIGPLRAPLICLLWEQIWQFARRKNSQWVHARLCHRERKIEKASQLTFLMKLKINYYSAFVLKESGFIYLMPFKMLCIKPSKYIVSLS